MVKNKYVKILIVVLIVLAILVIFMYKKLFFENNLDEEKIAKLNSSTQNSVIEKMAVKKILDFSSEICLPCKQLEPILEELKNEYEGKIDIITINVDSNPELSNKYKIMYTPTLVFMDENNNEISRQVGFIGKAKLKNIIENGGKIDGNI